MAENDNIQHGIDDNPRGDAEKGAALGGVGGLVTGAVAGAAAGPAGAIIGAIVGGVVGAAGSGVAVAAVDRMDNDNNVVGLGDKPTIKKDDSAHQADWKSDYDSKYASSGSAYENDYEHAYRYGHELGTHENYKDKDWSAVQGQAQSDWETSNPGTWDRYREPIQSSWERSRGMSNNDMSMDVNTSDSGNVGASAPGSTMSAPSDRNMAGSSGTAGYAYADNPAGNGNAANNNMNTGGISGSSGMTGPGGMNSQGNLTEAFEGTDDSEMNRRDQ